MLDQFRHPRHVVARIAIRDEHRRPAPRPESATRCACRGAGGGTRCGRDCVEGACVEIPEIEADERTVPVAGESRCDRRQPIVHAGVDVGDPNVSIPRVARCGGGHRGVQRLDLDRTFQIAFEKLDRALHSVARRTRGRRPAITLHALPASASSTGRCPDRTARRRSPRPGEGCPRARCGRSGSALRREASASGGRPPVRVPHAQRLARKLDPPTQRERERGSRRFVGTAHRGDHGADSILDRRRRSGTRFRDHRRGRGARCRSDGRTGNEERRYGQCADSRTWCIDGHGSFAPNRRRRFASQRRGGEWDCIRLSQPGIVHQHEATAPPAAVRPRDASTAPQA